MEKLNVSLEFENLVKIDDVSLVPDQPDDPIGDFMMREQARKAGVPGLAASPNPVQRAEKAASHRGAVQFTEETIDGELWKIGRDFSGAVVYSAPLEE